MELHVWPAMRVTPVLQTSATGWGRRGTAGGQKELARPECGGGKAMNKSSGRLENRESDRNRIEEREEIESCESVLNQVYLAT